MYRSQYNSQPAIEEFDMPFGGKLDLSNRWVLLAKRIPWAQLESSYAPLFSATKGAPAKPFRMGRVPSRGVKPEARMP
jgi:IS5 family transposase